MVARYRLGLDVGTASVGAAVVELNESNEPTKVIWHHVRIFDEPLEKGPAGLLSKKAGRRRARMQRRQIDRRASRLRRIAHLSSLLGLKREDIQADSGNTLPMLRAKAATERIELPDLMRIFLRMAKRRGYKGEFAARKTGEVADGSGELERAMKALAEARGIEEITLGQFLLYRLESGLPTKLKVKEVTDDQKSARHKKDNAESSASPVNLYALRRMVVREFDVIWDKQTNGHAILSGSHNGRPIRESFYAALFHQRPLKSASTLVAKCSLEPTLQRAPRAQMAFQRFRIEKTLGDLRFGVGKRAESLSAKQKGVLRELMDKHDKVSFSAVYDALDEAGCPKPQGKGLNLDRASRDELPGNRTLAVLRQLDRYSQKHHPERATNLESTFRSLDAKNQVSTINFLAELGSPEQLDDSEWHTLFVKAVRDVKTKDASGVEKWTYKDVRRTFAPEMVTFVNRLKEHDKFDRLTKMGFDGGRASYCVKALNALADWLEEPCWPGEWKDDMKRVDEEAAVRVCYPQTSLRVTKKIDKLERPEPTGNAVVDGALRQVRWTVNKMVTELGVPPSEIVVELARDMSLGMARRNEREHDNLAQQKARREAEKAILEHGKVPTPPSIRRYLLWKEQDKSFCPYCNQTIGIADALSGSSTEYEHIVPKSLTQSGMKTSEIVLAHHACNQEKGDRTPWEAWGSTERWQSVEAAAMRFEKNKRYRKAKLLRLKDFEREVLTDESILGFADRQFHQTSWIAKEALNWLEGLCPNRVSVSRGELTSMLRRKWGLETVIPQVRLEANVPVFDEGGKLDENGKPKKAEPITCEEFAVLKKYLEGHPVGKADRIANPEFDFSRRPDKRIDHRHHLIDAITIALTSRGLFQGMASRYKVAAEGLGVRVGESTETRERRIKGETRLRLEVPEPPMRNVRDQALEAVRQCQISVKPDHYPDGELFKGTAYGVAQREGEEKLRLTLRTAIAEFGKARGKTSTESARKAIGNIVSDEVRRVVSDGFEACIAQGGSAEAALRQTFVHPLYDKPICKVRCYEGYAEDAQPIAHKGRDCVHRKYLVSSGYAYLEITANGARVPRLVTTREAMRGKDTAEARGVWRIYKGDVVKDGKNGCLYTVSSFKAAGSMLVLPIFEPRSFKEANEKASSGTKLGGTIAFAQVAKRIRRIDVQHE